MGLAYPKGYVSLETPVIPKGFIGVGLTYSEDVCNPINIKRKGGKRYASTDTDNLLSAVS